jgi:hypothetical protein
VGLATLLTRAVTEVPQTRPERYSGDDPFAQLCFSSSPNSL